MRHRNVSRSIGLSICLAVGLLLTPVAPGTSGPAEAREGNKTLKLYFGHTKERGEFTFKRNGRYDKKEIARINQFLRDWRRNEPADMDPQLFDLIHAIYKEAGGRDYIHVVSAYRSLKTNNMLRSRSRGVAKTSQHTAGRAMDFYIPGVPLAKLRASAMKFQRGGVGYYPTSGSPFVHVDTGSVRYWPRMPRKQLLALFPNGETLYLPADGKPLPGYDRALARNKSSGGTALAYLETGDEKSGKGKGNWLKRVFSGGADEAEDAEATAAAPAPAAPVAQPAAPAVQPPAAPPQAPAGQPVPAIEPAAGEPEVLIAAQDAPLDARLPRARPGSIAETMVASLAPQLAPAPAGAQGLTTPAEIPVPRSRPDAQLLAQTLDPAKTSPAPLAVNPDDAIALLSLAAEPEPAPAAPVEVAALTPESGKAPASEADLAAIDAFTAIDGATSQTPRTPDGASVPRPRPLALAFAGSGLPPADVAVPVAAKPTPASVAAAEVPAPAAKGNRVAAVVAAKTAEPVYDADQDPLRNLLDEPAPEVAQPAPASPAAPDVTPTVARKGDFAGFAMPQPDATPELFKVPASAQSVAPGPTPALPTDRFQPTAAAEPPAEESFFSRLFASVSE